VAAVLSGRIPLREDATVVAILSGGNTDLTRIPPVIGRPCEPCPFRSDEPDASDLRTNSDAR